MKYRLFALIITLLLFLTACGGGSGQAAYSMPEISALPLDKQPAEIYQRYYEEEFVDTLRPANDYGQLYPYVGKISPITYFAGENRLFGLANEQGRIVLEPVLIRATKCATTEGEPYWELVYEPEDRPDDLLLRQLAALDGSWASSKYLCSDIEYNQERVIVRVSENKTAYNLSGQPLGDTLLATAIFTEGLAPVYDRDLHSMYYAMYYIDTAGQRAFAQGFSYADDFCGGLAVVSLVPDGSALIDKQGSFVVEPGRYTFIARFDGGYAIVRGQNGLLGLINNEGREIFPPLYRELYWLDEERTLLAGHLDWQIYMLNPADGSAELLPSGKGFYGDGWYYSQDRACKNLSLYKGEITRSFSVAEETDWGNRLECHYLGGDLFALSYQYRLSLVLTTGEIVGGDIDKERSRLDFYDAVGGRVVKSIPRYAFRGHKENGYYVLYDWDMWGNGKQMLLDTVSLEPLFGQSFDYISYLGNGLYSVLKDDYAGLRQEDGSWLLRVNINAGD